MNVHIQSVLSGAERPVHDRFVRPLATGRPYAVPVPRTPLLTGAMRRVDFVDSFAVLVPWDAEPRDPQAWADAIFSSPPMGVRVLFGIRELLVRAVGIESGSHAFDTVSWRPDEVLVGVDQSHLGYRASVLVERHRVVLSTIVQIRNRRGAAYFALVRRIHPIVVRRMLARAARTMATTS